MRKSGRKGRAEGTGTGERGGVSKMDDSLYHVYLQPYLLPSSPPPPPPFSPKYNLHGSFFPAASAASSNTSSNTSSNAIPFVGAGKARKMVNSYNTRGNVQAATHDISGVRDKMFGQSNGEEEGRVGDQSVVPDFFSHAHRAHATGIVGKRPRAAGSYDERNDAVAKVRGKSGGGGVRGGT